MSTAQKILPTLRDGCLIAAGVIAASVLPTMSQDFYEIKRRQRSLERDMDKHCREMRKYQQEQFDKIVNMKFEVVRNFPWNRD